MGKTKQAKEKKFDRNVEISAPILDPEIIKAIHTPPKGQRIDVKHGGFKALLSDLNSQDSTDELMPLNDSHVPSYIGISCAVSGYSNYSSYSKRAPLTTSSSSNKTGGATPNRSRATSPALPKPEPQVHHISIDKKAIQSADQERKELTEKLTASANEHHRSPSPCIPPTEDDRHHGAYVGARYCPLPEVSKVVNKHIPLLGIDDELDPEKALEEEQKENKVETKIASLYGDNFVEDWRESMTHKTKKELQQAECEKQQAKNPKDLVTLKPTPPLVSNANMGGEQVVEQPNVPVPNVKVLAQVENKQFLNKLLTDENPPVPSPPSPSSPSSSTKPPPPSKKQSQDYTPIAASATLAAAAASQVLTLTPDQKPVVKTKEEPAAPTPSPEPMAVELVGTSTDQQIEESHPMATATPEPTHMEMLSMPPGPPALEEVAKHLLLEEEEDQIIPTSENDEAINHSEDLPQSPLEAASGNGEEHIEYEIRAQSPVDNESSPVRKVHVDASPNDVDDEVITAQQQQRQLDAQKLVSFLPEPAVKVKSLPLSNTLVELEQDDEQKHQYQAKIRHDEHSKALVEDEAGYCSSGSHDGHYYLGLLGHEKSFILEQIARAESQLEAQIGADSFDEDHVGQVRSAIGKANLLINKKFNQFRELCEANLNKSSDEQFATLNDDLAGFWDMLSIQVADVKKSFETLWEANNNKRDRQQQQETSSTIGSTQSQVASIKESKPKLSAQKDQERRERLQGHISQMKQRLSAENLLDDKRQQNTTTTTSQSNQQQQRQEELGEFVVADANKMLSLDHVTLQDDLIAVLGEAPSAVSASKADLMGFGGLSAAADMSKGALEQEKEEEVARVVAPAEAANSGKLEAEKQEQQQEHQQETANLVDFGE